MTLQHSTGGYSYVGSELDLFAHAVNWKRYLKSELAPFVKGRVLEVGAGIGGTTRALCGRQHHWTCLEPDRDLARHIHAAVPADIVSSINVIVGTVFDIATEAQYDSILYVDVIEHIEKDHDELSQAAQLLARGGYLIVVAPAHQWLFSAFDQAIGHYRRYNRTSLLARKPEDLELCRVRYLDVVGILASACNRVILKSRAPTRRQISTWDRALVPISRLLDPALQYSIGKTIYTVWKRPGDSTQ